MRKLFLILLLNALAAAAFCAAPIGAAPAAIALVRYVDASRPDDSGDGLSWATAHKSLNNALNASASGDQIWVATGTYKPTTSLTDREASFRMKEGVEIYGGFTSGQMNLSNRDPSTNGTVLSGDIDGDGTEAGNSFHVINNEGAGLTLSAVLDGFLVTGGNADDPTASDVFGAGIYNVRGSPTIANCGFRDNRATEGGAIYNSASSPEITNCSFVNNSAPYGSIFGGNGGAVSNHGDSDAQFTDCIFESNSAFVGGAIYNDASSPRLVNCSLNGNSAFIGGAIHNQNNSNPYLVNCSLQANTASRNGGAVANIDSSPIFVNCSFQGNTATSGGAMYNTSGALGSTRPSLTNCVFWNNGDANTFFTFIPLISGITRIFAEYSLFDESVTEYGGGPFSPNFTTLVSPFFSDTDTRLRPGSPAIDAGRNAANGFPTDLAGDARIVNGTIDLGAYEFGDEPDPCPAPPTLSVSPGTTTGAPIVVTAEGCTGILEFLSSGGIGRRSGNTFTFSEPGTYSVTALCTVDGCTRASSVSGLVVGIPTDPTGFTITGVSGVACAPVPGEAARNLTFTPTYAGTDGSPITFDVQNETLPTTAPGPYTVKLYLDNPSINLRASQGGGPRVTFRYDWLAACGTTGPTDPPVSGVFDITGVSGMSCVPVPGEAARNLTFTPTYAGTDGSPISFDVQNETLPTTAPGPYTVKLYLDNPSVNLRASQDGGPRVSFRYDWLAACGGASARLGLGKEPESTLRVTLLGNPTTKNEIEFEVHGAHGQPLEMHLLDLNGRQVARQRVKEAGIVERQSLSLGANSAGILLLRVSTTTQSQTVKVVNMR